MVSMHKIWQIFYSYFPPTITLISSFFISTSVRPEALTYITFTFVSTIGCEFHFHMIFSSKKLLRFAIDLHGVYILYDCAPTEEKALDFLQRNLLVRSTPPVCLEFGCDKLMTLDKTERREECCFRCPSHKGQKVFWCTDTFFENSKLPCGNIVELIFS